MGLAKLADTWILYKLQRARLKSNGGFASNEVVYFQEVNCYNFNSLVC